MTGAAARRIALCLLLAAAAAPAVARAQAGAPAQRAQAGAPAERAQAGAGAPVEEEADGARDSPRAALEEFLALTDARRFAEAGRLLDLPEAESASAPELAQRLRAVLDRHVQFDLDQVSPSAGGDADDGLPAAVDEIARVQNRRGAAEPVRMIRKGTHPERWLFARTTVRRIDRWYDALELRWLMERIPEPLLRKGPRELPLWQWLAISATFVLAFAVGWVMSRITIATLKPIAERTPAQWDDALLMRIGGPLTFAWMLAVVSGIVPTLGLNRSAEDFVFQLQRGGLFAVFFWTLGRSVEVSAQMLQQTPWAREHPASQSLIPLGTRVGKLFVLALAVVALLSVLGYPVASLLAGLGIGGLAIALAAQKTVENLFGAFSIGADQPFRVGDFVKVEDASGTVEAIGLRSTRIRTLDRTLITIPNGKLAEMRLESYSARDRMRLHCVLSLVYGTSAEQLRTVLAGLERVLREQPKVWPEGTSVAFYELGESALKLEASAWFATTDGNEYQRIRQDVLLQFMDVVAKAGSAFAFPTRSLHVFGEPERRASPVPTEGQA